MGKRIKMDVKETAFDIADFIHFAPDSVRWWALVNAVLNVWVLEEIRNLIMK
jgi:hypothetical protein